MKKFIILVFLIFLISVGLGGLYWWSNSINAVSSSEDPISFVIPKGSSASIVGNKLEKSGVIRNALAFKIYIQITGKSGKIFPGEYVLYPNRNLFQVTAELLKGPKEIWVTIPEGLRHEEIALKFANGLAKTGVAYQEFITEFVSIAGKSEGYLFPSTYLFSKDVSAQKVVDKLILTFDEEYVKVPDAIQNGLNKKQTVILASLIERETRGDEEKPVVAGIIIKRLENEWPLQIDASVQYAVGTKKAKTVDISRIKYWETLTRDDLDIDSEYNVYKYKGLPPGPICNPGLSSLKAAAAPSKSSYWFYIHDNKGQIHYAVTEEEHTANVRKYLGK